MQTKATVRCHLAGVRTAIINKQTQKQEITGVVGTRRHGNPLAPPWECSLSGNSLAVPQKMKHRITIWFSNSAPRARPGELKAHGYAFRYAYRAVTAGVYRGGGGKTGELNVQCEFT